MPTETLTSTTTSSDTRNNTLTVTDNRTGKTWNLPLQDGCIRAADLRQIKVQPDEFGLMSYDPAFLNTAACRSSVTYLDGERGIQECRVVAHQPKLVGLYFDLPQVGSANATVLERKVPGLSGAVVGNGESVVPSVGTGGSAS